MGVLSRRMGVFDRNAPLPLPAEAGRRGGVLVLYSLTEQEVAASSKFFEPANRR
jgi:hypothetical protein